MSDLEHFFRQLVGNLAAAGRLHQQLQLAEIQTDILPYRTNRRALALDSAEDYEVLLLRLCAGEGGLARTEPAELQARFQRELSGSNPELSLLRTHGDALVSLTATAVARALEHPHAPYTPPQPVDQPTREETLGVASDHTDPAVDPYERVDAAAPAAGIMCLYCGGTLPTGRQVNFCPHCGQSLTVLRCPACQAEVEYGWRHCVSCGAPVGER